MNKRLSVLLLPVLLLAFFAVTAFTNAPTAHAAPHSPSFSGGGCSSFVRYGPSYANASYQSCISGNCCVNVRPDAYITFTAANPNLWSACHFTIRLRDDTARNTVTAVTYDCTPSARANAYYMHYDGNWYNYPPSGHKYHTYVYWSGTYNGQNIIGGTVNSPELYP